MDTPRTSFVCGNILPSPRSRSSRVTLPACCTWPLLPMDPWSCLEQRMKLSDSGMFSPRIAKRSHRLLPRWLACSEPKRRSGRCQVGIHHLISRFTHTTPPQHSPCISHFHNCTQTKNTSTPNIYIITMCVTYVHHACLNCHFCASSLLFTPAHVTNHQASKAPQRPKNNEQDQTPTRFFKSDQFIWKIYPPLYIRPRLYSILSVVEMLCFVRCRGCFMSDA